MKHHSVSRVPRFSDHAPSTWRGTPRALLIPVNEPIYTYAKGEGWIPRTHKVVTLTVHGHTVCFIERAPEAGEFYYCIGKRSSVYLGYETFEDKAVWVSETLRMSRILRGEPLGCTRAQVETDLEYFITIEVLD